MGKSILMYGNDQDLLESRTWVFETRGYRVFAAHDLASIPSVQNGITFDLLIVCHSVSDAECDLVHRLALSRWPGIDCLLLHAGPSGCTEPFARMFDTLNGPEKLLSAVHAQVDEVRTR